MPRLHPIAGLAALLLALSPARADEPADQVDPQIEGPARCAAVYTFFSVIIGKENPAAKAALTDAAVRFLEHASDIPPKNERLVRARFKANNDALLTALTDSTTGKAAREQLGEELKSCGDTEKQIFGSSVRERLNP
ncbi:MAG: hypothetical protein O9266_00525 [Porphyrobacter sp.]|jgi:hypothetical protein|nr:hypothetical protein [Porphyrobacter sp.]